MILLFSVTENFCYAQNQDQQIARNTIPYDVVDFSSLIAYKRSIKRSISLHSALLHRLLTNIAYINKIIYLAYASLLHRVCLCLLCIIIALLPCVMILFNLLSFLWQYLVLYSVWTIITTH